MRLKQENAKERANGRARRASIFGEIPAEVSNFKEEKKSKDELILIFAQRVAENRDLYTGEKRA